MIFLIGINHCVQCKQSSLTEDFLRSVSEVVKKYNIEILAEEWSSDADKLWKIKESNLSLLSKELNIKHIQVEPNECEKNNFGIKTRQDIEKEVNEKIPDLKTLNDVRWRELLKERIRKEEFGPRELYWVKRLKPFIDKKILFVCGDSHIKSASRLFSEHGFSVDVVSSGEWLPLEDC